VRTTLTLEDDLARELKDLAHERGAPFKQVVNDMLRAGLNGGAARKPYKMGPGWIPELGEAFGHMGGIRDVDGEISPKRLADELEIQEFLEKERQGG
jgi:hypothetical protein